MSCKESCKESYSVCKRFCLHAVRMESGPIQTVEKQTSYFPDDHTGEIIAGGLRDILSSWGLKESCQVCMTTDSGSNMIKALQLNKWANLGCFGHRLHNAIGKFQDCSLPCMMLIIKKK